MHDIPQTQDYSDSGTSRTSGSCCHTYLLIYVYTITHTHIYILLTSWFTKGKKEIPKE